MTSGVGGSTTLRLSGLVSGMDTDTLVKQMLAGDTAKIDKINANIQIGEWKTEAYREITSSLQAFYSTYFDPLSSSNLKSENSFSSFATSYGATTSTNYVNVKGGVTATAGTYSITKLVAAAAASLSGGNASKPVKGIEVSNSSVENINSANDNNKFVITLNNVTKQITLNSTGSLTTVEGLQAELQQKIDAAFGTGKLTVGYTANNVDPLNATGGVLNFSAVRNTDSFSIGTTYNSGASDLFATTPSAVSPFILNAANNKFELTIGGVTKTVAVPLNIDGTLKVFTNADDLTIAIQQAANDAFGGTADITFENTDGKVTYTSGQSVSIDKTENGANTALGLATSSLSNKVDLTSNIFDMTNAIGKTFDETDTTGKDIQFTINGTYFRFDSKETSMQEIMDEVNANTTINATMKYDTTTNSFSIKSKSTGATDKLVVEDKTGTLMQTLVGTELTANGNDASVTLSDGTEIVRSTNSFTYDGITYEIKQDFQAGTDAITGKVTDPISATISTDTTKTFEYIKGFVDKYNELVEKINTKMTEKKYRDYAPLTADQKSSMSEDQVKQWEIKSKSGLLKNDSILSGILSSLRSALYDTVEGVGITLSSIGITTASDYTKKGKLEINETKLKEALTTKSEQIIKLFTSTSDKTYFEAMNSSTIRSERNKESGIAQKLSDILQDAIRTNTNNNGNKGTLLDKAGITGDRSEYTNLLFKEMASFDLTVSELNDRLGVKEKALYAKFTAMESALSRLNEQQSYITQMFSSGAQ